MLDGDKLHGLITIPDGCSLFNTTKVFEMVVLRFGVTNFMIITPMRIRLDTIADYDVLHMDEET